VISNSNVEVLIQFAAIFFYLKYKFGLPAMFFERSMQNHIVRANRGKLNQILISTLFYFLFIPSPLPKINIFGRMLYGVFQKTCANAQLEFPHSKIRKKVHINMGPKMLSFGDAGC